MSYRACLRSASPLVLPGIVDCNSPAHWVGDTLFLFTSAGHPYRSWGKDLFSLGEAQPVRFNNQVNGGRWIESTLLAEDGTLYGWYHFEPYGICPATNLTAPQIGALLSTNNGASWEDMGIILKAPDDKLDCLAENGYFAGGHGDFCVVLDREGQWLYFFFGNYGGKPEEQGICIARMLWKERDNPVGKVYKWYKGEWGEPGIYGLATPLLPATRAWQLNDCEAFWGPSIHYNTHLNCYVMLINRAKGQGWKQEGIYISFSEELANPQSWSKPEKIYDGGRWYPQVIGIRGKETDKSAGEIARFFMGGISQWEILFFRDSS